MPKKSNTPTYTSWVEMRRRCRSGHRADSHWYQGRGISVCDAWNSYDQFLADMGERPPGTTLDRVDNSGGYSPENCRWADAGVQARNRRSSRLIEFSGITQTLEEWSRQTGIKVPCLRYRLGKGWPLERAFGEPAMLGRNGH